VEGKDRLLPVIEANEGIQEQMQQLQQQNEEMAAQLQEAQAQNESLKGTVQKLSSSLSSAGGYQPNSAPAQFSNEAVATMGREQLEQMPEMAG